MMLLIVRRRSNGRAEVLIDGRRSRIDDGIDCNFRSSSFERRMEKAMKVSSGGLRSFVSSSVTNAERKLN